MKWYKHYSDMSNDVKIKRLIRKYGAEGYALYNYVLELIVRKLEKDSPLPDLEESSADIAFDLHMDTLKVEEIMWNCVEQGLFEQDELSGRLTAHKIYKFLDKKQTRSIEIKSMIDNYTEHKQLQIDDSKESRAVSDRPGQSTDSTRTVGTRLDKTREDKNINIGDDKKTEHAKELMYEWYNTYNRTLARQVAPGNKDQKNAYDLLDRVDLETARKAVDTYFNVAEWPQYDSKKKKYNYNFASFCSNIETILSQVPEGDDEEHTFTDDELIDVENF